jgi:hypothetical protein
VKDVSESWCLEKKENNKLDMRALGYSRDKSRSIYFEGEVDPDSKSGKVT